MLTKKPDVYINNNISFFFTYICCYRLRTGVENKFNFNYKAKSNRTTLPTCVKFFSEACNTYTLSSINFQFCHVVARNFCSTISAKFFSLKKKKKRNSNNNLRKGETHSKKKTILTHTQRCVFFFFFKRLALVANCLPKKRHNLLHARQPCEKLYTLH